jgi:serine/threonine protein kinase
MVLTNEIETLKKLESENILKLLDVFTTINNTYIITEYCDQGDMGSQLKSNGALKEEQAVKVLMHVINGLKELQRHGNDAPHNLRHCPPRPKT